MEHHIKHHFTIKDELVDLTRLYQFSSWTTLTHLFLVHRTLNIEHHITNLIC